MANIFTLEKAGKDFVGKHPKDYKYMLRHVCAKIKDKDVQSNTVTFLKPLYHFLIFDKRSY